jgi:hypothetical protein
MKSSRDKKERGTNERRRSVGPELPLCQNDRFIPVAPEDLIDALTSACHGSDEASAFAEVAEALTRIVDQEASAFERGLERAYRTFDPDREVIQIEGAAAVDRDILLDRLAHLLDKANYTRLGEAEIKAAVSAANSHGLRVKIRPDRLDSLQIWIRGRSVVKTHRRTVRKPIKGETRDLDAFSRLVVVAQLKDDPHITIKLFRQIPIADVEALLPHAEVSMNWIDRAKVFGGGAGTLGATALKVLKIGATFTALGKLVWVIGFGFVLITVRSFMGYRSTRQQRDSQRTQHLYFQNIASNTAVVHRLVAMVASEELKEAVIAYAVCRDFEQRGEQLTREGLKSHVEKWLADRFGVEVRFDLPDALETMTRLELWRDESRLLVKAPRDALALLDEHWRDRRSIGYHDASARVRRPSPNGDPNDVTPERTAHSAGR